jgi:hypothetical protein
LIPIAKIAAPGLASRSQRKIVFRIFQDARGRWRAESDDGMTGGAFFAREAAVRFRAVGDDGHAGAGAAHRPGD